MSGVKIACIFDVLPCMRRRIDDREYRIYSTLCKQNGVDNQMMGAETPSSRTSGFQDNNYEQ